jgi:hypothetical protein
MTRWLQAAKQGIGTGAEQSEQATAKPKPVLSVLSVLSEGGRADPALARADGLEADAGAYLDRLRLHGPATYGAMASAMGWGATRAWRAEAKLRALGLVHMGELGRAEIVPPRGVGAKHDAFPSRDRGGSFAATKPAPVQKTGD